MILKTSSIKICGRKRAIKNDSADILFEKIRMLEKENQCLKNEIKNQ